MSANGHSPTLQVQAPDELVDAIADRVLELLEARGDIDRPMTVDEAADYLRCKPQRIYDLVHVDQLVPLRDGRRLLFRRRELDGYLERRCAA